MNLTKENYELLLFDLLEGNLDNETALEVMEQIESDPFYAHEWKLMQQTILSVQDEKHTFKGKHKLYKPTGTRVLVLMPALKYAAAVALVVTAWGGARWFLNSDLPGSENIKEPVAVEKTAPQAPFTAEKTETELQNDVLIEQTPANSGMLYSNVKRNSVTGSVKAAKNAISTTGELLVRDQQLVAEFIPLNTVNEIVSHEPSLVNEELNTIPVKELRKPVIFDDNSGKWGVRSLVNQGIDQVIGPFKNPKLQISKADKEKSAVAFNITFSSASFYSNTLVQLKR